VLERVYTPERRVDDTQFRVILCEHYNKNAGKVAERLADCNVVAVELVATKSDEVAAYESTLDSILAGDVSLADTDSILGLTFVGNLAQEMAGSNKKMHIVDARFEDREVFDYSHWARIGYLRCRPEHTREAVDEVGRKVDELQRYIGVSSIARELLIVDQLNELARIYKNLKIGVVVGSAHTAIPHMIAENYLTERLFVIPSLGADARAVTFPPESSLARAYTFGASGERKRQLKMFALAQHLSRAANRVWGPSRWYDEAAAAQLIDDYAADVAKSCSGD
jgi:hypothetical protein